MPLYISPPPSNPLTRLLMALVGLVVLVGSFMLGLVALAVIAGLALLAGGIFWLRVAWLRRQLRRRGVEFPGEHPPSPGRATDTEYIETEYTVVSKRRDP